MQSRLMASNQSSVVSSSQGEPSSPERPGESPPKKRGRTRGQGIGRRFTSNGKRPFPVTIPETARVPVGDNAAQYTTELSLMVRAYASLTVPKRGANPLVLPIPQEIVKFWEDVPQHDKDTIYRKVQKRFNIGNADNPSLKQMVLEHANRLYRGWRSRLHTKHYKKYTNDEDRLKHIPDSVKPESWPVLVEWFGCTQFKDMSSRNTITKANQQVTQTVGRSSFQNLLHRQTDPETGLPDKLDFFKQVHTKKKDNTWADDWAKDKYNAMLNLLHESNDIHSESAALTTEEVVAQVLGTRSGHVKGEGCGPRPAKNGMRAQIEKERNALRDELAQATKVNEALAEKVADLDQTLEMRVNAVLAQEKQGEEARINALVAKILASSHVVGNSSGSLV